MNSVKKSLKPGGLFLVSTPISPLPLDIQPGNPYHVQEWGFTNFQAVIKEFFDIEKIFVQLYPVAGAPEKTDLKRRVINKIRTKILGPYAITLNNNSWPIDSFSRIEEYKSQYTVTELGILQQGYQIVLARVQSK